LHASQLYQERIIVKVILETVVTGLMRLTDGAAIANKSLSALYYIVSSHCEYGSNEYEDKHQRQHYTA
jgi:hypothetical protein